MLIDDIERTIQARPGLTATQIAQELFGTHGYGERVRTLCQALHAAGRVRRLGDGRPGNPYRYYSASLEREADVADDRSKLKPLGAGFFQRPARETEACC